MKSWRAKILIRVFQSRTFQLVFRSRRRDTGISPKIPAQWVKRTSNPCSIQRTRLRSCGEPPQSGNAHQTTRDRFQPWTRDTAIREDLHAWTNKVASPWASRWKIPAPSRPVGKADIVKKILNTTRMKLPALLKVDKEQKARLCLENQNKHFPGGGPLKFH